MMKLNQQITFLILMAWMLLVNPAVWAGGGFCESAQSGPWNDPNTWVNCANGSGIPEIDNFVTIKTGHEVTLNVDTGTINNLDLEASAVLRVANSVSGFTVDTNEGGYDLSLGSVVLEGDLTLNDNSADGINLGPVDGGFALALNSSAQINVNAAVGAATPLSSLASGANASLTIGGNISTNLSQSFSGDVFIDGDVTLTSSDIDFSGQLDAAPGAASSALVLDHTGHVNITDQVGAVTPLSSLTALEEISVAVSGGATITTTGAQIYNQLNINSDVTLVNTTNSQIRVNGSSGAHALVVNSAGTTQLAGTIGAVPHSTITTDAAGQTRLSGPVNIHANGSGAITFNDHIALGPSANVVLNQAGAADVVFNASILSSSGSPHRLTINDDSGRTIFNDTVRVGELTTNDGAGDDVTVINTTSFNTQSSGANNGFMRFFDPVEVMQSVTIEEENGGRIQFYDSLNESLGAGAVAITLISDAEVRLGPVGNLNSPSSLTTDAGGTVAIHGDVFVNANLTFNDSVIMNGDFTLSGEDVVFNDTVDLQTHDLTLFALGAEANGVISGSGDLISDVFSNLALNAENDYTGQTIINNGILNLEDASSDNNISASNHIILSEFAVLSPNDSSFIFRLADGQTLSGEGSVNQWLLADDGSMVSPGASPGGLSAQTFLLNTGSQLNIEINGTVPETDYDQVTTTLADLNADALGGGDLVVQLNFTPNPSDEFIIISNPTAEAVLGTFNGMPEGSYVNTSNGQSLAVSYVGGDGNNVVLSGACFNNITVTDNGNDGPGTLRQALLDVCDGGSIDFSGDMTITVLNRIPTIDKTVGISAVGQQVILSGGNSTGIMAVGNAGNVTVNTLTFTEGRASTSGAISNSGSLTVLNSTFSNNTAEDLAVSGGAIYSNPLSDLLHIENSTFINNAGAVGGAIYNSSDDFTAVNSTFTLNGLTAEEGAAIYNIGDDMTLINVTIAENGGVNTLGAGIYTREGSHALINTLVADSPGGSDCFYETANSSENNSNSLIESGNCDADLSADPQLQALADNGGDTLTMALALTSPAVDAGSNALCPLTDQRGVDRPQLAGCDIGAYESAYLPIIYVDRDNITRSGICIPGACWANAYEHLNDALAVAGPTSQIWVAEGVYYPDRGAGVTNDDPTASFDIPAGVLLYGGFDGTETTTEQRDFTAHVTVLSGDIEQNDVNNDGNDIAEAVADIVGRNAFQIMRTNGSGFVIDGFTITAGVADDELMASTGAGLQCLGGESSDNIFSNNVWSANLSLGGGSAMFACGGQIQNSVYFGNVISDLGVGWGGAIYADSTLNIDQSSFVGNYASALGGAIRAMDLTINQSHFSANDSFGGGSAIYVRGDLVASNSLFLGNRAVDVGGAMVLQGDANLVNVTVTGNRTTGSNSAGGGIYIQPGPAKVITITNSIIWNNQDDSGIGTISAGVSGGESILYAHNIFQGSGGSTNWQPGAGIDAGNNIDLDPEFSLGVVLDDVPTELGNARLTVGSVAIGSGDNGAVISPLDLDNNPRIDGGVVDMGAYEYGDLIFADGFD